VAVVAAQQVSHLRMRLPMVGSVVPVAVLVLPVLAVLRLLILDMRVATEALLHTHKVLLVVVAVRAQQERAPQTLRQRVTVALA